MLIADHRPPPIDPARTALFLDLDGTLAEIAPKPGDVGPTSARTGVLRELVRRLDQGVAVLTGRGLEDADRILEGSVTAVAAVHGLERRQPDGATVSFLPSGTLPQAKMVLQPLVDGCEGLIIEDKGASVALHFRGAPEEEEAVRRVTAQLAQSLGLVLQNGSMVCELRTPGPNKGDALKEFLRHEPFVGRMPVMVGDDLTDEDGFAAADERGGYGVLVGPARPTKARYRLATVDDVLAWLAGEPRP